jgi:ABC-type cobalamin transport system permease subunit
VGATNVVTGVTGALLGAALAAIVTVATKRKITSKMILSGAAVGGVAGAFAPQYLPANAVGMVRKVIPTL